MEDLIKILMGRRTGSARDFFRAIFLMDLNINIPDEKSVLKFNDIVFPLYNMINNLHSQNQKLKEARDLLLPRLMNQTIEV